ncbi:MAG: hypothetical protein NTW87_12815 [Planctomycetota bacterium]|nr:hypothetical protein [Planctomycetota bacterium]
MRRELVALVGAVVLVVAAGARSETMDDIMLLAQKDVGEDILMAAVENSRTGFQLSAADIVKLKENKVPEKVIVAMLRRKAAAPAPAAPAVGEAQPKAAAPAAEATVGAVGTLNLENLDDRVWSYSYEPEAKTIWIAGPSADGRGNLDAHGGLSVRMPVGNFKLRYAGQENGPMVAVFKGDKSLIMLTRLDAAGQQALYATIFERGERKATARLAILRPSATGGQKKGASNSNANADQERVVERENIVEVPSPAVVYRDYPTPVYAPAYYPSVIGSGWPYYYPGYYGYGGPWGPYPYRSYGGYSRPGHFGIGYSNINQHGGFSIGVGTRF